MVTQDKDFFSRLANPFLQSAGVVVLIFFVMLVVKLLDITHSMEVNNSVYWVVGGAGLLFFAIFNSAISLSEVKDMNIYWYKSFGAYAGLLIASCGLAFLLSGLSIDAAGTFKFIYFILTFAYLLFLSLMRFMRKVVQIAQQEDRSWQSRLKK